jgi:hypothetical protein
MLCQGRLESENVEDERGSSRGVGDACRGGIGESLSLFYICCLAESAGVAHSQQAHQYRNLAGRRRSAS